MAKRIKLTEEQKQERKRAADLKLKIECLKHYCPTPILQCRNCGYENAKALSIEHKNNLGAEDRERVVKKMGWNIDMDSRPAPGGSVFYSGLRKLGYPEDDNLEILCANCQAIKNADGGAAETKKRSKERRKLNLVKLFGINTKQDKCSTEQNTKKTSPSTTSKTPLAQSNMMEDTTSSNSTEQVSRPLSLEECLLKGISLTAQPTSPSSTTLESPN